MASGGGITASLWTAQVLTGLQKALGDDFPNAINLISAVSGGTVGAMYYVDAFTPDAPPNDTALAKIVEVAGQSTLEHAAWGLIYPDFAQMLFWPRVPFVQGVVDRGWAMERAWDRRLGEIAVVNGQEYTKTRMLGDWVAGVEAGWRPAVTFNATEAETGERFLFSSATIPPYYPTRTFYNAFPDFDLSVATAARMASTFPYVTPLARAAFSKDELEEIANKLGTAMELPALPPDTGTRIVRVGSPQNVENWNLADGGYFDNDGTVTALEWLKMILEETSHPKRIILVQILASGRATRYERCDATKANQASGATDVYSEIDLKLGIPLTTTSNATIQGSWVNEFFGPVRTLLSTWGNSQVERGQSDIDNFISATTQEYPEIRMLYCIFDLREGAALSWQLAPSEIAAIHKAWDDGNALRVKPRIEQIAAFMRE
jgi:hypothetical protein